MSFDTLMMQQIRRELDESLKEAFVQRVTEASWNELALELYTRRGPASLLFSIAADYARVHLTTKREKKSRKHQEPSSFTMLLRKYLVGAKVTSITSPTLERVLVVSFKTPDGLPAVKLVAEIMGRRSNLILLGPDDIILGAVKTADRDKNPLRPVISGMSYLPVPAQDKLDPLGLSSKELKDLMEKELAQGKRAELALVGAVHGVSPLLARELLSRARWAKGATEDTQEEVYERLSLKICSLFEKADAGLVNPVHYPEKQIFALTNLTYLADERAVYFKTANELLDSFYQAKISKDEERVLKNRLEAAVKTRLKALETRKKRQEEELLVTEKAPEYRLFAETLLAFGAQVPKGASTALLPNLYNMEEKIIVPLNPSKNASTNAHHYFNLYRKAKNGRDKVLKQLALTRDETHYCRGLLYDIENSDAISLPEINEELLEQGYIKEKKKSRRQTKSKPEPLKFTTSTGLLVLVGKNNRTNDYITFKAAARRDTWFHARLLPGSHVVLKNTAQPPTKADFSEAAFLAAYFSKGRLSKVVDVDYTQIRHVRRRPGGKPGLVFYENFDTLAVNPDDQRLKDYFSLK